MKFNQKKWDEIVEKKEKSFTIIREIRQELNDARDVLTRTEQMFYDMESRFYHPNVITYNNYIDLKKSGVEAIESALESLKSDPESVIPDSKEHVAFIFRIKELYEQCLKFKKIERKSESFKSKHDQYLASYRSLEDFAKNHIKIPQKEWVAV